MPITLAPFDPSRDFIAQTNFRAGGVIWIRKQPFDKSYVNTRVLEQLYNQRKIAYAPPGGAPTTEAPAAPPSDPSPDEQHAAVIAEEQTDETTEAVANKGAPADAEAAAAPDGEAETAAAATDKPQLDHDHDGEPGGSEPKTGGTTAEQVKRLCGRFNRTKLLSIAHGLELAEDATKAVIAEAIVKAGRADNEPA